MIEFLSHLDQELFFLINQKLANPVFDVIMPFITTEENFIIPLILLFLGLLVFGGRRGRIVAMLLLFTVLLSDQLSSSVLKPLFGRIRPCNALEGVRLLDRCSHSYSFPSSHATNSFAAATVFSAIYRKYRRYLFAIAALVAYSRPYVGVHYPSDVIFGAVLGILCGYFVLLLYGKLSGRYTFLAISAEEPSEERPAGKKHAQTQ